MNRAPTIALAMLTTFATSLGAASDASSASPCDVADCMAAVVERFQNQGWLGVNLESLPSRGLLVAEVVSGGPGERAGVRVGDLVLAIGGASVDVAKPESVHALLERTRPGQMVELRIRRGDDLRTLRIRARSFPPERLAEAVGTYVLSVIHLCHHPDHQTFSAP